MCGRGRLFPDTEQPPQNAPHAAGRTPHHDLHALTSCHASTPRRRRSAETPPETSGTPPETRRRSGCPVPAPARRSPETSFRRHIVARYIPPLLQYMKERTRRAWRAARRCFLSFRVCRGGRLCPPVSLVRNDRGVGLSTRKQRPAFRPPGIRKHTPQKARLAQPHRCAALTDIQYACGDAPRLCTKRALFRCEAVLPK